jgi:hypothetical protein
VAKIIPGGSYCSTNNFIICFDVNPCFPHTPPQPPIVPPDPPDILHPAHPGQPQGMVPDVNIDSGFENHVNPGPPIASMNLSGWDQDLNFFSYQEINDYLIGTSGEIVSGSYVNDISSCEAFYNKEVPNTFLPNEHLKSKLNVVVDDILRKANIGGNTFETYAHVDTFLGSQGKFTPLYSNLADLVWRSPPSKVPYNEQLFYLLKDSPWFYDAISDEVGTFLESMQYKNITSHSNFRNKYMTAITKSILIGKFDKYFPNGKMQKIQNFAAETYAGKDVLIPITTSSITQTGVGSTSSINFENSKAHISKTRRGFNSRQSLTKNILNQYWKFVASDINLRTLVYLNRGSDTSAVVESVKVNDDDSISTHRPDGTTARVHYINAEHLRVFNNSGAHVYLDETPRYQSGCNRYTSGAFIPLYSDRERSYVFDPIDRTQLLGVLGAITGSPKEGFDTDPYIKLTVSAPYTSGVEFKAQDESSYVDRQAGNMPKNKNWYLLTPDLSGSNTLSSTVDPDNPYVKTTTLKYKIQATSFLYTLDGVDTITAGTRMVDRAVRFISGPGNVCFVGNDDPFLYYLQGVWANTDSVGNTNRLEQYSTQISATIPDLNIDGILDSEERYPRRIPYHILVVPTDQPEKNPFVGKSRLIKMVAPSEGDDGMVRELKFVPAPTRDVLNSNYLDLVTNDEAFSSPTTYQGIEIDKFPYGPQGTSEKSYKMQFSASNVHESFDVWVDPSGTTEEYTNTIPYIPSSFERNRKVDPIRKVWDFIGNVCSYYDTKITRLYESLNPPYTQYPPPIDTSATYGLPLFDVWRSLNMFEFHEFLISFKDEIFQKLTSEDGPWPFFNTKLFYMPGNSQEPTYLHNYVAGAPTWATSASYGGTVKNPRNASGIDFIESALVMGVDRLSSVKKRDC